MKDWTTYSQTKAKTSELNKGSANVLEYALIKIVDNGLLVSILGLSVLFVGIGTLLFVYDKSIYSWFFDIAKLCFGVVLGMLAERKKK